MESLKKRGIIISLVIIVIAAFAMPSFAVAKKKTVKVGFMPLDGFFEYNQADKEVGYGVDLLNKISIYSNIDFEYVKIDRSKDIYKSLDNGEVDILMPVTDTDFIRDKYKYSKNNIIGTFNAIMTSKNRDDLYYDDKDTLANIKIAVMKNQYDFDVDKEKLFKLGVSKGNLDFYNTYEECLKKLNAGKVDAVLSNIMDLTDDLKLLQKFDKINNYIIAKEDFKYMGQIDKAIDKIKIERPTYFSNLFKDYFSDKAIIPLNKAEILDLKERKKLDFYFSKDSGSLSRLEDGEYVGFLPELAKDICKDLGVEYNVIKTNKEFFGSKAAVRTDFYYDKTWAKTRDISLSKPYLEFRYVVVTSEDEENNNKVGLVKGTKYGNEYLKDYLNMDQVVWYDGYNECLEAVKKGKIGSTIINNYIAEYYLKIYKYDNLNLRLTNFKHDVSFGIYGENNENIVSAINKSLTNYSENNIQEMLVAAAKDVSEEEFWVLAFYKHTGWTILIISIVLVLFFLLILMVILAKSSNEKNDLLQKADKAKSDFLSQVSHDIRTPMNAIIGFSNIGINDDLTKAEILSYMSKINMSANHLSDLINNVLDMSKIENDKMQLNLSPTYISEIIKHVETVVSPRAVEKDINFGFKLIEIDDMCALIDKVRMIELLINLITNGIKFTPTGGMVFCELIKTNQEDSFANVIIKVRDTGVGMSEDFQNNMFDPFAQEENYGEGTGLGLAIVKNIVDLMGGTISVNSVIGQGTEFEIKLDFQLCTDKQLFVNKTLDCGKSLKGKRILIVEDHPMNRLVATKLLEREGVVVDEVVNGLEAVKVISKEEVLYDAILMDIRMPVMGGLEAARAIRELHSEYGKTVPIIAMTANAFKEDVRESKSAGMNQHLSKPIVVEELYSVLIKEIYK
ncbi:MAG: transporter substrate-binding domain-containing protein [Anaerovoracaceae bacterium]